MTTPSSDVLVRPDFAAIEKWLPELRGRAETLYPLTHVRAAIVRAADDIGGLLAYARAAASRLDGPCAFGDCGKCYACMKYRAESAASRISELEQERDRLLQQWAASKVYPTEADIEHQRAEKAEARIAELEEHVRRSLGEKWVEDWDALTFRAEKAEARIKVFEDVCRSYDQQVASEREDARAAEADLTCAREEAGALREALGRLVGHSELQHAVASEDGTYSGNCKLCETVRTLLSGSTSTETSPDRSERCCPDCGYLIAPDTADTKHDDWCRAKRAPENAPQEPS